MPDWVKSAAFRLVIAIAMMFGMLLSPIGTSASHNPAALAEELDQLLVQNDFDALARFRELKTLVFGTVMESDFDEVGRLVGELRFSAARECLRQVFARTSGVTE